MALKLGTSQAQREMLRGGASVLEDQHEIEKGDNLFRFIQGPQMIKTIFYPTVFEKEENGEKTLEPTYRALNFLDKTGIIESIQEAEAEARREIGDQDPIGFSDKNNWFYLAIKLSDKVLKIKPLKVPKSIKDKITEFETKLDIKNPDYLMNGLFWMYDINVTKTLEPGKSPRYGTKYDAFIYGENPFRAKIPQEYLKADIGKILEKIGGPEAVFYEEIIPLLENLEIDLEKELTPMKESEIKERLQKFPINILGRRSNDHSLIYPQGSQFKNLLRSLGLPYVEFDVIDHGDKKPKQTAPVQTSGSGGLRSLKKPGTDAPPAEEPVEEEKLPAIPPAPAAETKRARSLSKLGAGKSGEEGW